MRERRRGDDERGLTRRRLLAGAATVGAAGLAGCTSFVQVDGTERTVERSFPAADVASVRVADAVDDVEVTATDASAVRARATAQVVGQDSLSASALDTDLSDGVLSVSTARLGSTAPWPGQVDLEVAVPRGVTVEAVSTADGDIAAGGVDGPATFGSGDGDVAVEGLSGSVTIRTDDGDVSVGSVDGRVSAITSDGDIAVGAPESVGTIRTDDGDVVAAVPRLGSAASVQSADGDVVVTFGDALDADIEATTGDGTVIAAGLDTVDVSTGTAVTGQVGSGGPELTIHTDDGDVTLR